MDNRYPIGTKFYNPTPSIHSTKYWILLSHEEQGYSIYQSDCGAIQQFPEDIWYMGDVWNIEIPKEHLFDKLYLTLKS